MSETFARPVLTCPDCQATLTGEPACAACGLPLQGPRAARLWQVDVRLAALDGERDALLVERAQLLAGLRNPEAAPAYAGPAQPYAVTTTLRSHPPQSAPASTKQPAPRKEADPRAVQNTLLAIGGLLLAIAAIVFTAVTYERLGAGGRAVVLLTVTAAAGYAGPLLLARKLTASAETTTAVTLVLAALDCYGLRTLGLGDQLEGSSFTAWAAGALAVLSAGYAVAVQVRLARIAAVGLAQLPPLALLLTYDASAGTAAFVLAALAVVDLVALLLTRPTGGSAVQGRWPEARTTALVAGVGAAATGILVASGSAFADNDRAGAVALLLYAVLAVTASTLVRPLRAPLSGGAVVLLGLAGLGLALDQLTDTQLPLVGAAVALLAVGAAALLPRDWRPGPVWGALVVATGATASQAKPVLEALLLPFSWLADPWTVATGLGAREALTPNEAWSGTVVTLVVLAATAAVVIGAGAALQRLTTALPPAAVLVVVSAVLLPLGLATSFSAALALLLVVGVAAFVGAAVVQRSDLRLAAVGAGTGALLIACGWALADQTATLVVLPLAAAAFTAGSLRPLAREAVAGCTALAAALATSELAAAGAARDLASDQVGALLLVAPALLVGGAALLARTGPARTGPAHAGKVTRRGTLEAVAVGAAGVAVALTATDAGWLTWSLALTGLLALAVALQPDRRQVAYAGTLLLAASSWVRLADTDITAPEPYVVPLALVALTLGHLRRRREPSVRSFPAYGPGLSLGLVPSLLASPTDDNLTRPLLLGLAALAVLLLGARGRLQAPLAFGAGVLAVDALHLLAPYAAALPRWLPLLAAGVAVVSIGATYEKRRQDLAGLRERFGAMG